MIKYSCDHPNRIFWKIVITKFVNDPSRTITIAQSCKCAHHFCSAISKCSQSRLICEYYCDHWRQHYHSRALDDYTIPQMNDKFCCCHKDIQNYKFCISSMICGMTRAGVKRGSWRVISFVTKYRVSMKNKLQSAL